MLPIGKLARSLVASGCVAALAPSSLQAEVMAIDISGGDSIAVTTNYDVGWSFTLSQAKLITALGFWDNDANGLSVSHDVALWNTSGGLLAQAVVTSGSTPVDSFDGLGGQWLFENLATPLVLNPGTYILGADYADSSDLMRQGSVSFNPGPDITFVNARFSLNPTAGLDFPDTDDQAPPFYAYFGPNMMMEAVPEPSSMLLVGLLTAGGGFRAVRRKFFRG
jgi:hypothetical protein